MAVGGEPESSDGMKAFGAVAKVFRERAKLSREQLAPLVRYSPATIASIEQGRRFPQRDFVDRAEEVLDAFGVLHAAARHLARHPGLAAWFREWARLEEGALNLWVYECRVIPGLLQSEDYARSSFRSSVPPLSDEQIEERVAARMGRQRLLRERPNSGYSFIIEEALFRRETGGPEVTRELIDHVLGFVRLNNVDVQIMPLRQWQHAGLSGPLQLLETPDNQWLAYSESQFHGHLYTDAKEVGMLLQRYAKMRSQALTPQDSVSLLERMRGVL